MGGIEVFVDLARPEKHKSTTKRVQRGRTMANLQNKTALVTGASRGPFRGQAFSGTGLFGDRPFRGQTE
jgi:hypothetical protein